MLIVDSREKRWEHIKYYLTHKGIDFKVKKLDVGDYMAEECPTVIIDRKRNLDECAQNLYSRDSSRFWRELRRAHDKGIKLVFLVEHGGNIHSINDVPKWNSRYSVKITGKRVADEMFRSHVAYGVDWLFCRKQETAKMILEILKYDNGRDKEQFADVRADE